jgi:hypothetical protein
MNKTPARAAAAAASRTVVVTTVAAVCAACGLLPQATRHAAGRARHEHQIAAPPRAAPGPATPAAILPVSAAGLQTAAAVAARFAVLYDTAPPGGPGAWLARLRPIVTSQLDGALARAAATPDLVPSGTGGARVTSETIRVLAAGSVIFTVTLAQPAPGGSGLPALAVTVVPAGSGWLVYDVEPASAGNLGGGP